MKANFKPMAIAAAVATAAAGYAGMTNAQILPVDPNDVPRRSVANMGDLGIVPYYTVQDDWVTGVHIINNSPFTQVVKLRLRRATDSADALDFNLIMSPFDEWVGSIDDSSGNIVMTAGANQDGVRDTTCTAPLRADGRFPMPDIYRDGAEEGYIEVIGMGATFNEAQPIALTAKHANGVPASCTITASNFFANASVANVGQGNPNVQGNLNYFQTASSYPAGAFAAIANSPAPAGGANFQCFSGGAEVTYGSVASTATGTCVSNYVSGDNALKVSYFIRDAGSGIEFGGDAIHIANFSNSGTNVPGNSESWMTNQEFGLFSRDPYGFDYPDLDGGPWMMNNPVALRNKYNTLRQNNTLGVLQLFNDWSVAAARGVSTDWVVTMPGQYAMLDYYVWLSQNGPENNAAPNCGRPAVTAIGQTPVPLCDFRDIPVVADLFLYDREEGVIAPEDGELVISPAPPGTVNLLRFPNEVNVVEWTDGTNTPVLGSDVNIAVDTTPLGESGWATLSLTSATKAGGLNICYYDDITAVANPGSQNPIFVSGGIRSSCYTAATGRVPAVGFVAWERSFPQNPDANYGRLINHSYLRPDQTIEVAPPTAE